MKAMGEPCPCRFNGGMTEAGPAGATYTVPCDHEAATARARARLSRAHHVSLGLDRSVRLGDVVEALQGNPTLAGRGVPGQPITDGETAAAFLVLEFGVAARA